MNATKLGIRRTGFLMVTGDTERLDVYRSIAVEDSDLIWEAVPAFIAKHDLILAWEQIGQGSPHIAGEYRHQVYIKRGVSHEDAPPERFADALFSDPETTTKHTVMKGADFYWE